MFLSIENNENLIFKTSNNYSDILRIFPKKWFFFQKPYEKD